MLTVMMVMEPNITRMLKDETTSSLRMIVSSRLPSTLSSQMMGILNIVSDAPVGNETVHEEPVKSEPANRQTKNAL